MFKLSTTENGNDEIELKSFVAPNKWLDEPVVVSPHQKNPEPPLVV